MRARENRQDAMTSVQTISISQVGPGATAGTAPILGVASACLLLLSGCFYFGEKSPVVNAPLRAPYPADKLWAVAPLSNESGVSMVDTLHYSDLLAEQVAEIDGVDVLPVQRVLEAYRALDIAEVRSPGEAVALARLLGADGVIAGVIYSFDPYTPPRVGMTLQLYARALDPGESDPGGEVMRKLEAAPSANNWEALPGLLRSSQPVASVSRMYDASDNAERERLRYYAQGRGGRESALGWERFLIDMDLYMQYVYRRQLEQLLQQEQHRLFVDGATASRRKTSADNLADGRGRAMRGPPPDG